MVTDALIEWVEEVEGFTAIAKEDGSQWSNGFGTEAWFPFERINRLEAGIRLRDELEEADRFFNEIFGSVEVGEWRQIALTSLLFNIGAGSTLKKTGVRGFYEMLKAIRRGDWDIAALEFVDSKRSLKVGVRAILEMQMLRLNKKVAIGGMIEFD